MILLLHLHVYDFTTSFVQPFLIYFHQSYHRHHSHLAPRGPNYLDSLYMRLSNLFCSQPHLRYSRQAYHRHHSHLAPWGPNYLDSPYGSKTFKFIVLNLIFDIPTKFYHRHHSTQPLGVQTTWTVSK